jgi:hypothetical protein
LSLRATRNTLGDEWSHARAALTTAAKCADTDAMQTRRGSRSLAAALTALVVLVVAPSVLAATLVGRGVRATATHGKVTFITMELYAHCTNGSVVIEGPGFQAPFAHPQSASGRFADSYSNLVGSGRLAGQLLNATFAATIHDGKITGTVTASSVYTATHVRCSSGPVAFHAA